VKKPTCKELFEEEFKKVYHESFSCRWYGKCESVVYYREEDDTYWRARYRLSKDGEINELREGCASITQVMPKEVVTTIYEDVEV